MEKERYDVTWHVEVIRYIGNCRLSLGLCARRGTVAFIAVWKPKQTAGEEVIKTLVLQNVYVEKNHCEDGDCCIDLTCPLNRANLANFKKYGISTKEELDKLHVTLKKWKDDLKLTINPNGGLAVYKKPLAVFKRKRKCR